MLITCYYYAPHNHCLLARHLDEDLAHIASLGSDAVAVCVQEDQLVNWHQQRLRNVVDRCHAHGLACHAVPNRWCGLVAGWLDGHLSWPLTHRDCLLPGKEGAGMADPSRPEVAEHYAATLRTMLERFAFDGVIWDEPRPAIAATIDLLDRMSAVAKEIRPGVLTALFAEASNLNLAPLLAATRHIDHLGADGHVRRPTHRMHRMKTTIFESHAVFHQALTAAGRKTLFLLEAQRHRDEDLDEYLACLDAAFALPMDHLMWYYSAHELSAANEERFNQATWAAVQRLSTSRR